MMSRPGNAVSSGGDRALAYPWRFRWGGRVTVSERQILGQILEQD